MAAVTSNEPIYACMEKWHQQMAKTLEGGFDAVLHPDVVFYSPVVFTPQVGREITKMYLMAADDTIGGGALSDEEKAALHAEGKSFRYTKQVLDGNHAILEFETTMDGKSVNGVDIFTCDDDAMITEMRVMIRPLQAVQVVHAQMMAMLEKMQPPS